jgi:PilZ domain
MSEHTLPVTWSSTGVGNLSNTEHSTSDIPTTPDQERRSARRARIGLRIRVRSADFKDGQMEQIAQTMNASRKGYYFRTALSHYYKGMHLRIVAPFHDHTRAADTEEMAEVVRVDQKSGIYGIAIVRGISPEHQQPVVESQPEPIAVPTETIAERRSQQRSPFVAAVEMVDVRTGAISKARTADLSMSGCYVDTLNPLPIGATVEVAIQKPNESVKVQGNVCMQFPGSGMGVAFDVLTPEQSEILTNWLHQISLEAGQISA